MMSGSPSGCPLNAKVNSKPSDVDSCFNPLNNVGFFRFAVGFIYKIL